MSGRDRSCLKKAQDLEDELRLLMEILDRDVVCDSDIDRGLDLIEEVHSYLEKLDFDESSGCVAVLGTTGVGKSTVVSFLFSDGKLLVHHENPYSRVLVAENRLSGIDIHSGLSSKTLIPGVIRTEIEGKSVVVFDMPGSQDTRGPFAELVSHSIVKWILAKHEQIHFLLVATSPQERPQEVALAKMINRVYGGGLNAVLVCTKCSADFEPESITASEGIAADKRSIPVFALAKPLKSHKEGCDYSAMHAEVRCAIRSKLVCPVPTVNVFAGSVPESAQLLLQFFRKRTIEKSRDTLSEAFLEVYSHNKNCRSFHHIQNVLDALASQQTRTFDEMAVLLEQFLPRITWPRAVKTAQERLKMIEKWCGESIVLCKEEWLTEKSRIVLKDAEKQLIALKDGVRRHCCIERNKHTKTLVFSAWHLQLSRQDVADIKEFVGRVHPSATEDIPTVVLIGFMSLSLDVTMQMWTDLVVISPNVHISSSLDMSAVGCAPAITPSRASPGQDGVHGAPGLCGGSFFLSCRKLDNDDDLYDLLTSTGQDGGVGQDAGNGISGDDVVYSRSQFEADAEQLIREMPTLDDVRSVRARLVGAMKLKDCSSKKLPPTSEDVTLAAMGSAIVTATTLFSFVPNVGPGIGMVGLVMGGILLKECSGRHTMLELKLVRPHNQGTRGVPPGRRGQGGCGGLGGEFYVVKSDGVKYTGRGAQGCPGNFGRVGRSSHDGRSSARFKASVHQDYDSNGKRFGESSIKTTEIPAPAPQERTQLAIAAGKPRAPIKNPSMTMEDVKVYYDRAFARLVETFPQCTFENVVMP